MTRPALHPTPRGRDVLREQVRAVGLALRWPAAVAAALALAATLLIAREVAGEGGAVDFAPERQVLPGALGLLLPVLVWQGERRFGAGFLWTLPVDRRRHALARVFAGWVWLMAAVALFVLWLLLFSLATGDGVLAAETVRFVPAGTLPELTPVDPETVRTALRAPQPLLWLVPFTAATATYLLGSALALAVHHPVRWIAGSAAALFLAGAATLLSEAEWLRMGPSRLLRSFLYGPWGADALFTARTASLTVRTLFATGEWKDVWLGPPVADLGQWAAATLLWTGAGLAALLAAAARHRERRRA